MSGYKTNQKILNELKNIKKLSDIKIQKVKVDEECTDDGNIAIRVKFNNIEMLVYIANNLLDCLGAFYYYKISDKIYNTARKCICGALCGYFEGFVYDKESELSDQIIDKCVRLEKFDKRKHKKK